MKQVLKAKSAYTNADVQHVWDNIEDYVTKDEAETEIHAAVRETLVVTGNKTTDVCYGWSGGKDSLALQVVMERAGIHTAILGSIPHLEFQSYMKWIDTHAPEGLIHYGNPEPDVAWLARPGNQKYLFPADSKLGYKWTLLGTRRAQLLHQETHHPRLQIYGRRTMDGNFIPATQYGIHAAKKLTTYSPIRYWSHELVLAVIHYSGKPMPPVYGWPEGWKTGTSSWPGRRVGDHDTSWANTYAIEPDRVREAADYFPSARTWLENHAS